MSEYNSSPEEEIKYLKITKKNNTLSIFSWESYSNKKKKFKGLLEDLLTFSQKGILNSVLPNVMCFFSNPNHTGIAQRNDEVPSRTISEEQ